MEQASFGTLNSLVLVAYLLGVTVLALSLAGRQRNTESYFLAGRSMPWLAVALSTVASMLSGLTYLGAPAASYKDNASLMLAGPAALVATPLIIALYFPIYRRLKVTTVYEYVSARFGNRARYAASALAILQIQGWMGIALYAPALALSTVSGIDLTRAILLMGLVATAYTCTGGLAAVIWTDVIQFLILTAGAVLVAFSLVERLPGGLDQFFEIVTTADKLGLADTRFDFAEATGLAVVLCYFIAGFGYGNNQVVMQRLFAARSRREMARALILDRVLEILVVALLYLIGLGIFAYFQVFPESLVPGIAGDRILPYYIVHALPAGVSGLLIAAIFAAAMSTVDSGIHSAATLIQVDFVAPLRQRPLTQRQSLALARAMTAGLGLLATAAALFVSEGAGILDTMSKVGSLTAAPVTALFLLGILTRRGHFLGWLAATLGISIPLSLYVQNFVEMHWIFYTPIALVSCLSGSWIFSLLLRSGDGQDRDITGLTIWKGRG